MANNNKRKWIIVGSLLVLGGVAAYFGVKAYKKRKAQKEEEQQRQQQALIEAQNAATLGAGVTPPSTASDCPAELNTPEKIKAFQDYMDTIGVWVKGSDGKYKKLNKGSGYGNCGSSTIAAWKAYGKKYLSNSEPNPLALVKERIKGARSYKNPDGSESVVVDLRNGTYQIEFYNNGRYALRQIGVAVTSQGNYADGGREITSTSGVKSGQTFKSTSFYTTIKNLLP